MVIAMGKHFGLFQPYSQWRREKKPFYKTDELLGQIDKNIQMEMREKVLAKNTDHSWFHQWIVYTIKNAAYLWFESRSH